MGKGSPPPPAPTQTQVVRSEIPDFFRPFLEDIFRRSSAISKEAYITPPERGRLQEVGEQTLAPVDPAQQTALDRLKSTEMAETGMDAIRGGQGLSLTGSDIATAGAQRIGGEELREAMNPFQQAVTDIAIREELRRAEPQRQAIQAQAARSGAFGGSRGALLEAEFERNLGQRLADIQTTGGATAFDRATQRLEQERQRQIGAGQAVSDIGGQLAGLGVHEAGILSAGVGRQLAAGEAQRGLQTEAIGRGLEEFQREVDYPKQQIGFYSGILRGYQPPMNTYKTTAAPFSATQQMLGQAAAAGALGKGFGLFNDGGIVGLAFGGAPSQQYTESVGDDKGLSSMVGNPVASYAPGGITQIHSGPDFKVFSQNYLYSLAGRATPNDPNTSALIKEFQRRRLPVPPALVKSMAQARANAGLGSPPPVIPAPTGVSKNTTKPDRNILGEIKEGFTSSLERIGSGFNNPFDAELFANIKAGKEKQAAFQAEVERRQRDLGESVTESRKKAAELIYGKGVGEVVGSGLPTYVAKGTVKGRGAIAAAEQAQAAKVDKIIETETKRLIEAGLDPDKAKERASAIAKVDVSALSEKERAAAVAKAVEDGILQEKGAARSKALKDQGLGYGSFGVGRIMPPSEDRPKTAEEAVEAFALDADPLSEMEQDIEEAKPTAADAPPAAAAEPKKAEDLTDWFGLASAALAASTGREEGLTNAAKLLSQVKRPEDIELARATARYRDVIGQAGLIDSISKSTKSKTAQRQLLLDISKFRNDVLTKDRELAIKSYEKMPDMAKQLLLKDLFGEDADVKNLSPEAIIDAQKSAYARFRTTGGAAAGGVMPDDLKDRYGITSIQRI
tara:strand:- start:23593 stop:26139 length:2547 start_codon:yes stop_codon:yes gene_type:complete